MELDYYHEKMNARVDSRVAKILKTDGPQKLGNFKKIPEMFEFDGEYAAVQPKAKFSRFSLKNCKNSAATHSIEKPIMLNFVNLSTAFCPQYILISNSVQTP